MRTLYDDGQEIFSFYLPINIEGLGTRRHMIDIISRRKEESGFGEGRGEAEGMQSGAKNKVDLVENGQDEGKFQQRRRSFNHKEGIWEL